jgi:hypothetical protein
MILSALGQEAPNARLIALADAACNLFSNAKSMSWSPSFARLGDEAEVGGDECQRMIMISAGRIHVVERLTHHPETALAAISLSGEALGNVLSGVRATLSRLDVQ